jgi:cytochrome o ubiquinol oxidase subunit 3
MSTHLELIKSPTAPPDKNSKTMLGFWIYLMTDCVLFASLFAAFAVLRNNTFGGPPGSELFSLPYVLAETLILLVSSFTCGLAVLAATRGDKDKVIFWFSVTFLLGVSFLALELSEFARLARDGHSWRANGFLSSFFTLVGTHGLHITSGLIWMFVMVTRIAKGGLTAVNVRRLTLLSLFWHFLDVIWIFIFTIVYLIGAV